MAKRTVQKKTKKQAEKAEAQGGVMEQVAALCQQLKEHKLKANEYEDKRKEHNKAVMEISTKICDLAEQAELVPPFNLATGGKVVIKEELSVVKEDEDKLLHWLDANDQGDVIKSTVNAQTLKALCRKREKENKPYPDGVKVTSYFLASFKTK